MGGGGGGRGFSKGETPAPEAAWSGGPQVHGENLEGQRRGEGLLLSARAHKAAGVRCCYLV